MTMEDAVLEIIRRSFWTINPFARTCRRLAELARTHSVDLANLYAREYGATVMTRKEIKWILPNGELHGIVRLKNQHLTAKITYVLGQPVRYIDSGNGLNNRTKNMQLLKINNVAYTVSETGLGYAYFAVEIRQSGLLHQVKYFAIIVSGPRVYVNDLLLRQIRSAAMINPGQPYNFDTMIGELTLQVDKIVAEYGPIFPDARLKYSAPTWWGDNPPAGFANY